jgi:hypothetical protein
MSTPGMSLVGFFTDPNRVLVHLRHDCVPIPPTSTDNDLLAFWHDAQANIGLPFPNAGHADPQPLTPGMQAYVQTLTAEPWVVARMQELNTAQVGAGLPPATFQTVEIDTLLAYQFAVDQDRSNNNCNTLGNPPTEAQLLDVCLPNTQPHENYFHSPISPHSQSVIVKLRSHNLQLHTWGIFDALHGQKIGGVLFGVGLPFVHVVRWNGRCFLHNGYHRVCGARAAGATRLPCLFREVASAEMAGIRKDGSTFDEALLTSANPPTIAHYTQGRASGVRMRARSRVLHVTWQQYSVPDEYD